MTRISLDEIKRDLPAFLRRVETGETLLIVKAGKPVAELKPVPADTVTANATGQRPYGLARGEFVVPDDFNDPLPENIIAEFEGR